MSDLEAAVEQMTRDEYTSVQNALNTAHSVTRGRLLPIGDAVRTAQIRPSGAVLWLLRSVGTTTAKEQIDRHIEPELGNLINAGADITEVFALVHPKRQISLDVIIDRPLDELPTSMRIEPMKPGLAREILGNPERWPMPIVQTAVDWAAAKHGQKMRPLAQVADKDYWNVD